MDVHAFFALLREELEEIAKADAYYEQRARASVAGAGGNTAGGWRNGPDEQ